MLQWFLGLLESIPGLAHYALGVKARRKAINHHLFFCALLLGSFPSNLEVFAFKFHLEVLQCILDIDVSGYPHD